MERRRLVLRRGRRAVHLGAGRLVEAGRDAGGPDRLEEADRREAGDVAGVFGHLEAHPHVALRAEMVDLAGLHAAQQIHQADAVVQVAVVQSQPDVALVRVLIDRVESLGVERRGPADQPVHVVALGEQEFRQVRAVLPGDAGDEGYLAVGGRTGRRGHAPRLALS